MNTPTTSPAPGAPLVHTTVAQYAYRYPHPAVAVDCVVFGTDETGLKILLIQRRIPPFENQWALPGGFVRINEDLEAAARRELSEEAGVSQIFLEQLYTFGAPGRDPRERVISVTYYALVRLANYTVRGGDDARNAAWFPLEGLPALAFDHQTIIDVARRRLQGKVLYEPIGFELLPHKFKLSQLQQLYERILGRELDKRNFRRKIMHTGLVVPLREYDTAGARRPAQLFRFDREQYEQLRKKGFAFEI